MDRARLLFPSALRARLCLAAACTALTPIAAARADDGFLLPMLDTRSAFGSAVILGLSMFATTLAILTVRDRRQAGEREAMLTAEIGRRRDAADRAEILLGSERQVLVVWSGDGAEPLFEGDPTLADPDGNIRRVLAFGTWLVPGDAGRLEAALDALRERGQAFRLAIRSAAGDYLDAEGRTIGGKAVLRLRDVSGDRASLLAADEAVRRSESELAGLRTLLDLIDDPIWLRGEAGEIAWVNAAYARAVDAPNAAVAANRGAELLDRAERDASARRRQEGLGYRQSVPAIVAGTRRTLHVVEVPLAAGRVSAGGLARDVSEAATLRADLQLQAQSHTRVLDHLPTAVATFDAGRRLVFHNAAYRLLWSLDPATLEAGPTEGEILDRLRAARRLPEQADFRAWKESLGAAYRSAEPVESWWHLPDRRTLRVVANPNPQGGVTYLFDDVSDRVQLESRLNALVQTQRETLDSLAEGVALFGPDGRLKLFNEAFAELWRLDRVPLAASPHIDVVIATARGLSPDEAPWARIKAAVASFADTRRTVSVRMERRDGSVVDAVAEPLPDGGTLLAFADVTAQVNVERALTERNDALEHAARLRNEFVHHVSYELRSPLTNIIGFAELLGAETVGSLNERQREWAGHITRSSGSLLAIINDILDLASIDTDTIELTRDRVDIREAVEAAASGIQDRLVEAELKLAIDVPDTIGSFPGDPKRVRQILYNLLSNAAGFSQPGQIVRVAARRDEGAVSISVTDQGRGIPEGVRSRIFDRFESHTKGSGHRGAGLGLSIVRSFVELHGGRVDLVSEEGAGTTVTCVFPVDGDPPRQLAASVPSGAPASSMSALAASGQRAQL